MVSRNEIKLIKSLNSKKNRLKELLFTVEGEKMVDELLNSNYKNMSLDEFAPMVRRIFSRTPYYYL